MRTLVAACLITMALAGCMTPELPTEALPAELNALGLTDVTDQVADWAYAIIAATESGDATGVAFIITEDVLATAESGSGDLLLQVTPVLPVGAEFTKYGVVAFDTGRSVVADAQGEVDGAAALAPAPEGLDAELLTAQLFAPLSGVQQTATGTAQLEQAIGAGPTTLDLGAASQFQAGDVIALVIGAQTTVDALSAQAQSAADAQAAIADVQGQMAVFVQAVGSLQATAPEATDAQAIVDELAAEGQGQAMALLGSGTGFAVPAFLFEATGGVDPTTVLMQSSDVQAEVESQVTLLGSLLNTNSFDIHVITDTIGGFGAHTGVLGGDLGQLDWALDADVHGLVTSTAGSGINAGNVNEVNGAFSLLASGAGATDILMTVEMAGRDATSTLGLQGFEFGTPLEDLIGQGIAPVEDLAGSSLPIDGPL